MKTASSVRRLGRVLLFILGGLGLLIGLLWIGQGTGFVPWPRSSFMIAQTAWAWRGLVVALIGLGLIVGGRRL